MLLVKPCVGGGGDWWAEGGWLCGGETGLFSNTGVDPTSLGSQTYSSCWVSLAARKVERGGSDRSSEVPGIKHSKLADFEGFRAYSKDNSSRNRPKLFDFGGFRAFSKDSHRPVQDMSRGLSQGGQDPWFVCVWVYVPHVARGAWQEPEAAESDGGERERAGQGRSDTV